MEILKVLRQMNVKALNARVVLLAEWGIGYCPPKLQTCVRTVLKELSGESQLIPETQSEIASPVVPEK